MSRKIQCSVLTPDRVLFEGHIDFAVVQAHDGEIGFLFNHAPLVAELGIGEVRLRSADQANYLIVEGGFVEIRENELIVLAESAFKKEELAKDALDRQIKDIETAEKPAAFRERMVMDLELKKLKARLRVASR
ncbi:MAG: ATP synthase F1 subunit epsilon [Spirochaetes bacterium]|nr:MAG: ATP synthase F1 subunit epsilon [Spirochaetota bacterium]